MKSRSRDVRSTRREVNAMKRAFFDLEASQIPLEPEFAEVLRKNQRSLYVRDDSPFTLPNGTQVDPREPSAQAGQEER